MTTFALLPAEIIIAVISHLSPSIPRNETKGRDAWLLWRTEWRCLLNLSLSCRSLGQITKPFLYQTVALGSGESIAMFLAALLQQPWMRGLIRDLLCLVDLTTPATSRAADEAAQSQWLRTVHSPWQILAWAGCDRKDIDGREGRHAIRAFNAILCLAPGLRTLLLDFTEGYPRLDHVLPALHSVSAAAPVPIPDPSTSAGLEPRLMRAALLNSLTDLRIRYSRRVGSSHVTHLYLLLARLPALVSLELYRFHGLLAAPPSQQSCPTAAAATATTFPQLRHLRLLESYATSGQVAELCRRCPRLRTLAAHFYERSLFALGSGAQGSGAHHSHHLRPDASSSSPGAGSTLPGSDLNEALAGLAPSLESLELLSMAPAHLLGGGVGDSTAARDHQGHSGSDGDDSLLTCLPLLTNLRHLTVNLRGLCGPGNSLQRPRPHLSTLPPSLQTVTLLVGSLWSFFVLDTLATSVSQALQHLRPDADACDNNDDFKWPALRRVTLRLDLLLGGAWGEVDGGGGGREQVQRFWDALEPERQAFAELGVEFVEEERLI